MGTFLTVHAECNENVHDNTTEMFKNLTKSFLIHFMGMTFSQSLPALFKDIEFVVLNP